MKHKSLSPPFHYFGGKQHLMSELLKLVPSHKIFVEVFSGSGSLLLAKPPSDIEIYNDINKNLVAFYRAIRTPSTFEKLRTQLELTPHSRSEYHYCKDNWEDEEDEVEKLRQWFVLMSQCYSGIFAGGWSMSTHRSHYNISEKTHNWIAQIDKLYDIHMRLRIVQIECLDFRKLIPKYDGRESFMFMDPPYIHATRRQGEYEYEMNDSDHKELVELLLDSKGKFLLSGYQHPIYEALEHNGWERRDYKMTCSLMAGNKLLGTRGEGTVKNKQKRIESVWISPNANVNKERTFFGG